MPKGENLKIIDESDNHYTLTQLLTVKSGIITRIGFGLVLPVFVLILLTIKMQDISRWLSHFSDLYLLIGIVTVCILISAPWSIGTCLFGHILLPYYAYLITGTAGYYTYSPTHSVLKLNHQVYLKYDKTWLPLSTVASKIITDQNYKIES